MCDLQHGQGDINDMARHSVWGVIVGQYFKNEEYREIQHRSWEV